MPSHQLSPQDRRLAERAAMEFIVAGMLNCLVDLQAQARNVPYAEALHDFAAQTDRHLQALEIGESGGVLLPKNNFPIADLMRQLGKHALKDDTESRDLSLSSQSVGSVQIMGHGATFR